MLCLKMSIFPKAPISHTWDFLRNLKRVFKLVLMSCPFLKRHNGKLCIWRWGRYSYAELLLSIRMNLNHYINKPISSVAQSYWARHRNYIIRSLSAALEFLRIFYTHANMTVAYSAFRVWNAHRNSFPVYATPLTWRKLSECV